MVGKSSGRRIDTLCLIGCAFGFIGGLASVALDLDHILGLWLKGLPITWENLATQAGRPLHIPALVVSGVVCVILGALRFGWIAFLRSR